MNGSMLSSNSERWGTPASEFKPLNALFNFTLDVCAERWSAKVPRFFSRSDDGLSKSWRGETWFMNPPFGRRIGWWVDKARHEAISGSQGVLVLPARVDSVWWRTFVLQADSFAGDLLSSGFEPVGEVFWFLWERLVVGVRFEAHRWEFDLPPGADAVEESAPFPTALVVMSDPRLPPPPRTSDLLLGWPVLERAGALGTVRRSRGSGAPSPTGARAASWRTP